MDEAHGLINPEHKAGRGQFGFVTGLGPQAYHIIRTSQLTVFLLDPAQGYRERENTSVSDIARWSLELGAGEPELISLEGSQFRCGGSAEYVSWVEAVLEGDSISKNRVLATAWATGTPVVQPLNVIDFPTERGQPAALAAEAASLYRGKRRTLTTAFDFRIFDTPADLERALRDRAHEGESVRLLSSYSREWKTATSTSPHDLPPSMQDFFEQYLENGETRWWSRVWNFVPRGGKDYTAFIRAAPGSRMADDPLCEVGCPYAVRGFDYDYVGILWLEDLVWRNGKWRVNHDAVHESGIMSAVGRARAEGHESGPDSQELLERVGQAYRILLTRPLRGVYLWVPDDETRRYMRNSLTES